MTRSTTPAHARRSKFTLAAVGLALAAVAFPQAAAGQRASWAGYVDSLAIRTDTAALRAIAPRKADKAGVEALVAGGFAQLRVHQLTGSGRDIAAARKLFDAAVTRSPKDAWARYGYALALVGGPGVRLPSPGGVLNAVVTPQSMAQIVGLDPASHARRELKRALKEEPGFTRAALELARQAQAAHDHDDLVEARDALARIREAAGASAPAELVLALSEADRALGDVKAAAEAATSAGADAGAAGDYARGTALLRDPGHEQEGARAYMAGVERLDSATAARYYADIRYIATDEERGAWSRGDLAARKALLKEFWSMRAAVAGVEVADRLADHYRRLAVAEKEYHRDSSRGAPPIGAHTLLSNDSAAPFDDRGVIYLRHGPPDDIVRTTSSELRPNESWVYQGSQGAPRSFHFIQFPNSPGYRLVDNVLAVVDPTGANFNPEPLIQFLDDRIAADPELAPLLAKMRSAQAGANAGRMGERAMGGSDEAGARAGAAPSVADLQASAGPVAQKVRDRTTAALRTDTDAPQFDAKLPFYYDLFTFRGKGGKTDVVAALAVPADRLTRVPERPDAYVLRLSFIVVDTARKTVTRVDTTYALRSDRRLGAGDYIRVEAQVPTVPTDAAVERLVLRDAAAGSAGEAYAASVPVREYAGGKLTISDIVLAEPRGTGAWRRGDVSLALVPPRQFPEGSFAVFYEIYNLRPGASFETTIRVEGMDRDAIRALLGIGGGSIRLAFRGEAQPNAEGVVQAVRRIKGQLKPGRYRITIQIRDVVSGESATRSRELIVRKEKEK